MEGNVEDTAPRKKRTPKKKALPGQTMEGDVPAFAKDFPSDPELHAIVAAFQAGNYLLVRERAPMLARDATDPRVAEAARELRRRIDPDPLARTLLLSAVGLLLFLALWAFRHPH